MNKGPFLKHKGEFIVTLAAVTAVIDELRAAEATPTTLQAKTTVADLVPGATDHRSNATRTIAASHP
jgi:hypothetical protein